MSLSLAFGKRYSFSTVSPVFLGSKIINARLRSSGMDADMARKFAPIDQLWAQIYPSLPAGTINDVNAAVFYVFEALNKSTIVMAESWIVPDSIEVVESITITATIPAASVSDADKVRIALVAAGLTGFTIAVS